MSTPRTFFTISLGALGVLALVLIATAPYKSPRSTLPEGCTGDRRTCLQPLFQKTVHEQGAGVALARAESLYRDRAIDDCHFIAHDIGEDTFRESGDLGKAFAACTPACNGGCYHGAVVAAMRSKDQNAASILALAPSLCSEFPSGSHLANECMHGEGHGFYEFFDGNMDQALGACKGLPSQATSHDGCRDGVFMQYASEALESTNKNKNALATICERFSAVDRTQCIDVLGEGIMIANGHQKDAARATCGTLVESVDRMTCEGGVEYESNNVRNNEH